MSTGVVRRIYHDKGFGFIESPEGSYFFHRSGLIEPDTFITLRVGQTVEFEPQPRSPKGLRAELVQQVRTPEKQ